jgi:hypothetical protein
MAKSPPHERQEYPIGGGQAIDLLATRAGRRIALEIETGKAGAAANVEQCLGAGIPEILVVATSEGVKRTRLRRLPENPRMWVVTGPEAAMKLENKSKTACLRKRSPPGFAARPKTMIMPGGIPNCKDGD